MRPAHVLRARRPARPVGFASWTARVLIVIGPVTTMSAAFAAGASWSPWLLALIALGGLACALNPESHVGLGVILVLVWHWGVTVDDVRTPATMVAALGIALFHTAMAAASVTPPSAVWPRSMCVRWLQRFGLVIATVIVAWAVELAVTEADLGGSAVLLLAALVIMATTALVLRARSLSRS